METNDKLKLLTHQVKSLTNEIQEIMDKHVDMFNETSRLVTGKFLADLKAAKEIDQQYFANAYGEVIHVLGIIVDGTCNLMRSGYNGEDNGVFVQFTALDKTHNLYKYECPIVVFNAKLEGEFNCPMTKYGPCTKDQYEHAMSEFIQTLEIPSATCIKPIDYITPYSKVARLIHERRRQIGSNFPNIDTLSDDKHNHMNAVMLDCLASILCRM
jgi:hypothetical protein